MTVWNVHYVAQRIARFPRNSQTVLTATQLLDLTANRLTELDSRLLKLPGNQHAPQNDHLYRLISSPKVMTRLLYSLLCPRSEAAAIEAKSPDRYVTYSSHGQCPRYAVLQHVLQQSQAKSFTTVVML